MIELVIIAIIMVSVAVGSFILGWRYHARHIMEIIDQVTEELIIDLTLEQQNKEYFLYRSDDKQFVAQGSTMKSVAEQFSVKYGTEYIGRIITPGHECFIVDGHVES
jgi:F0F1-type ATP synthase alpha subunit